MRLLMIITLIITITIGNTYAYKSPTIAFDKEDIENRTNSTEIKYSEYATTAIGTNFKLSSKNYYIKLLPEERPDNIKVEILKREQIDQYQGQNIFEDYVTASEVDYPIPDRIIIGRDPLFISDELTVGNVHFARLRIFPVTIDTAGTLLFNEAIQIRVGNRTILPSELLTENDLSTIKLQFAKNENINFANSESPEYVIITSSSLTEPCERLAEYKSVTGIKTVVKNIEDILPQYPGRDDAERLREYLKVFFADGGKYVLMAGDETILPLRYAYHSSTSSDIEISQLQIADLYFADMDGDWNADGDNIWGERNVDYADLTPELNVGRLPFNTVEQMNNYVDKLITYETNPGNGNRSYLEQTFFFCSDQMRDYSNGQHNYIARAFPDYFIIDTVDGIETPTGLASNPTNPSAYDLTENISEGFGIVNIIAHGRVDAFGVWTTEYNIWPKSYFITGPASDNHGSFLELNSNNRTSLYYSIACDNGAFDKDQGTFGQSGYSIVSELLSLPASGAIGFVANSRWGWVGSSYYLQTAFYDSLFAHPEKPAVEAMYASKEKYYYYRDLVLGQNYYGDPTLKIYTLEPKPQEIDISYETHNSITVLAENQPLDNSHIYICLSGNIIDEGYTNSDGEFYLPSDLLIGVEYTIASVKNGYSISLTKFTPSLATDIKEHNDLLPVSFSLYQNYPNPFNPSTSIEFDIPVSTNVKINIFNNLGQEVATLIDKKLSAGSYTVEWDGKDDNKRSVSSGIYFYRLSSEKFSAGKRMILIR